MAVTCQLIIGAVAEFYMLPLDELLSDRRLRSLTTPRRAAYFLAKKLTGKSLQEIGRYMGGRDHSTVLHGVKEVEQLITSDGQLRAQLHELETIILAAEITLSRIGVETSGDIDPLGVANRLLYEPLGRLQVSVDELKHLCRAVINQSAALDERSLEIAESEDRNTQTARHLRETFAAFEQWKSDLYSAREKTSNLNLERHLSALKARFEQKETRT